MVNFAYLPNPKPGTKKKDELITFKCSHCSTEFSRKKSSVKGGINGFAKRFCSPQCHIAYKKANGREYSRPSKNRNPDHIYRNGRTYKIVNCVDCGTEMERRADQESAKSRCTSCLKKVQEERMKGNTINPKTGDFLSCQNCGKQFYFFASKLDTRKYCSKKCMFEWQREHLDKSKFIANKLSGKDHPRYKHGKRVGKHENKPKLRAAVVERDGGKYCLMCGKPGPGLHLHRVIYGSQCGKYELGNCVLLCGEHHALVHSNKKKWQPLLLDYLSTPTKVGREWADNTAPGRHWLVEFRNRLQVSQ